MMRPPAVELGCSSISSLNPLTALITIFYQGAIQISTLFFWGKGGMECQGSEHVAISDTKQC